jgi:drug/metabolite transporter (DMT)-like permease
MTGVAWAILAAVGFGIFQTLNRKASEGIDTIRGTFILLAISALILVVVAVLTTDLSLLQTAPVTAYLAFIVAGFLHFFIGWSLITVSQNQIGAARTGAVIGTMPLFGLIIDLVIYNEVFSWQALLGVFLVVGGVIVVSLK